MSWLKTLNKKLPWETNLNFLLMNRLYSVKPWLVSRKPFFTVSFFSFELGGVTKHLMTGLVGKLSFV